ncbi:MAG: T9SS type A sorting domain-containing protein [Ignavibacteriaceae bacterium]|jgi:hypothetical protein
MIRKVYQLVIYFFIIIAAQNIIAKNHANDNNTNAILALNPQVAQDSSAVNNNILKQNYPNPFNPTTTIEFTLPEKSNVKLNVYNVLGVKLTTLVQGEKEAGTYSVKFNASRYPSGLFIYELQTDNFKQTKKMIYLK